MPVDPTDIFDLAELRADRVDCADDLPYRCDSLELANFLEPDLGSPAGNLLAADLRWPGLIPTVVDDLSLTSCCTAFVGKPAGLVLELK